jgi:BirA family transcriptional regulator, biotin operon repressor / biotin---[acetyl-CoA-carboxylase] ligase
MTTKEKVHELLTGSARGYISGEDLAEQCGVSRAAIWKAIDALRKDGCVFDAVTNRGYRIVSEPDNLDEQKINKEIKKLGVTPGAVFVFSSIDSTNTEAKRRAAETGSFRAADGSLTKEGACLHRALIAADQQTAGRGRMGRPFFSPLNSGVYMSIVFSPLHGVSDPALMTAAAAVAVCRAVESCYGAACQIKWVNDVFAGGKKICGILTEGISNFETGIIEAAIVGIGINLSDSGFSPELANVAGSIEGALKASVCDIPRVSRNVLTAHVAAELLALFDSGDSSGMLDEYRKRSFLTGKTLFVNPAAGMTGTPYKAKVTGISDDAGLVVQLEDGSTKTLHSGEVSLHSDNFTGGAK